MGPGSAIFGFLAKNDIGYKIVQPNWCHGSPFHEPFMSFDFVCRFCPELGPGKVIIGFFAKNNTGYTNSRPNWRQESLFYDHLMIFTPRSPSRLWEFLKQIRNLFKEFSQFRLSFLIPRFPYCKVNSV